ncbi:VOC family protein [Flavobacterium soyangense]|uniref:VOC family protein n=1 Tax=Flavobacterium soyangense TaxID=2023265 RepID=UPI001E65ADC8|nr:VOC family protein [Flavobacterium soyangense]
MIKGLYETHLFVSDINKSIDFYKNVLKLEQCYYEEDRKSVFFWIGKRKQAMLGLWEKPKENIDIRHFAFECETEFILNESVVFLNSHHIKTRNFLNNGIEEPLVLPGCLPFQFILAILTDIH